MYKVWLSDSFWLKAVILCSEFSILCISSFQSWYKKQNYFELLWILDSVFMALMRTM